MSVCPCPRDPPRLQRVVSWFITIKSTSPAKWSGFVFKEATI
jgi:hypothetical protein